MEEEKRVDESWKNQVEKEKEKMQSQGKGEEYMSPDFSAFVFSLVAQAAAALESEQKDTRQALFIIEILNILQEKTNGNLTPQETEFLSHAIQELQMAFVKASPSDKPRIEIP